MERSAWERSVKELHAPVYRYVQRMLRDEATALDVTQTAFAKAWQRRHRLAGDRLQPWLFRVALNEVRHVLRDRERHARIERKAAREMALRVSDAEPSDGFGPEERERVEAELDRLPVTMRSLLCLHYYEGLSQREIASILRVPRTTVAYRLRRALDQLRSRLDGAGAIALVPCCDVIMRSAPRIPVPAGLEAALAAPAASATMVAAGSTGLALGGIVVSSKSWMVLVAVIVAMTFGIGFGTGRVTQASREEPETDSSTEVAAHDSAGTELRSEAERLRRLNRDLEARVASLAERVREQQTAGVTPEVSPAVDAVEAADASEAPTVDWDSLAQAIKRNRVAAFRVGELIAQGSGSRELEPEMEAMRRTVMAELEKQAAIAKLETPFPLLDESYFSKVLETYLDGFLDLAPEQVEQLQALSHEVWSAYPIPDDVSPRQAYEFRSAMVQEFTERFDRYLTDAQRADLATLEPIWSEFRDGPVRRVTFGYQAENFRDPFLRELREHYRFGPAERDRAVATADDYLARVGEVYQQFGVPDTDVSGLDDRRRAELEERLHELQLELDRQLYSFVNPDVREQVLGRPPLIIRFEPGQGWDLTTSRPPGF